MNQVTVERFWRKVDKSGTCWLWTASKRSKGYGAFVYPSPEGDIIQGRAHRFSWELHFGPVPDGKCVLHHCDNPACVRPDHLFIGTKADNNRDMCQKGRHVAGGTHCGMGKYPRGEHHHNAKLTAATVRQMRAEHASGSAYADIGKRHGVGIAEAFRVVNRQRWGHIE